MKKGMNLKTSNTLIELTNQQIALNQKRKSAVEAGDNDGVRKIDYHLEQTEVGFDRIVGKRRVML